MDKPLRFTRGSRKHLIGKAHAKHVMATVDPIVVPADEDADERFVWIGPDDRGLELEIIAINLPSMVLVIHVMPTALRKKASP